jgi:hypothetical protein
MDNDLFYTDVAEAVAAAEHRGELLIDILLAGIDELKNSLVRRSRLELRRY